MKHIKLFEDYTPSHFSFGGVFKDTSAKDFSSLPKELKNITKKFSGKSLNFGITEEDGGKFKVYKWESIFEPIPVLYEEEDELGNLILKDEYVNLKDAQQAVRDNDK